MNLIQSTELSGANKKINSLEYSLGSALECAAGLDVTGIRGLLGEKELEFGKQKLLSIVRMEIRLRQSWQINASENSSKYCKPHERFYHEDLKVYQKALKLCEIFQQDLFEGSLENKNYIGKIDSSVTSLILNIAEGNGRFSLLDHNKFIDIAINSSIKLIAFLDLIAIAEKREVDKEKALLKEILAMLKGMKGYLLED